MISRRALSAIAVSLVLLAVVLWVADIGAIDLTRMRPGLLIPALAAYIIVLVLRGALLRQLAPESDKPGLWQWVALAGRHQFIFILSPSGSGDLAFPVLARRMVGLDLAPATGLIAGARLRDICAILGLGCAGLAGIGYLPAITGALAIVFGALLYFSNIATALIGGLIRRIRKTSAMVEGNAPQHTQSRLPAALLTLALWLVASGGVTFGFAAAGNPLSLFEAWVMIAGLNLAGAVAVSLAGIGVAEAGATGVLVFLGLPLAEAASIAVVARPLLLLSNCAASGVIEVATRLKRSRLR